MPYKRDRRGWRRKSVRQVVDLSRGERGDRQSGAETPAAAAGLQQRRRRHGYNGTPIYNPIALAEFIDKHPTERITLDGAARRRDHGA